MRIHTFIILVCMTIMAGCETSPTGRQQLLLIPDAQLQQMGSTAFLEMKQQVPVSKNKKIDAYVGCVTDNIIKYLPPSARGIKWELAIFKDDSANAFALPGGKIGVHTGLLDVAKNQDQLAAVIAHEIAHVLAQHHSERVSQQFVTQTGMDLVGAMSGPQSATKQQLMGLLGVGAQLGILLPYSRAQESEADVYGLDLMARAGFDPRQSVNLWRNMSSAGGARQPEFLASHPTPENRIRELQNRIPQNMPVYERAIKEGRRVNCG